MGTKKVTRVRYYGARSKAANEQNDLMTGNIKRETQHSIAGELLTTKGPRRAEQEKRGIEEVVGVVVVL